MYFESNYNRLRPPPDKTCSRAQSINFEMIPTHVHCTHASFLFYSSQVQRVRSKIRLPVPVAGRYTESPVQIHASAGCLDLNERTLRGLRWTHGQSELNPLNHGNQSSNISWVF
jgi:hypothetical protein